MPSYFENYNSGDLELIKKQLGSKDVSACGIFKRCKYGFPQIIFQRPVKKAEGVNQLNHEAVSNIIWLTCPYLNYKIHELENASYIKKIKAVIQNSQHLKLKMLKAHADYYFTRNIIFKKYAGSLMADEFDFTESGIGGIRDLSAIKCLHLHYSHYNLCKYNVAGYLTFLLLGKKNNCDDVHCSCYK
ncbi:MAG: DUF501 domain-containing protein [Spirochaetota bacterium]